MLIGVTIQISKIHLKGGLGHTEPSVQASERSLIGLCSCYIPYQHPLTDPQYGSDTLAAVLYSFAASTSRGPFSSELNFQGLETAGGPPESEMRKY